jgi:hypothetical protein
MSAYLALLLVMYIENILSNVTKKLLKYRWGDTKEI